MRHFIGVVDRVGDSAIRVHGYAFIRDAAKGAFVRRKGQRTRLFPLDNQLIIFLLPEDLDIQNANYDRSDSSQLIVTDGKHLHLDLSEFNN